MRLPAWRAVAGSLTAVQPVRARTVAMALGIAGILWSVAHHGTGAAPA